MNLYAIAPSPVDSDEFVELSSHGKYRVFEKHILNMGTLLYNGRKVEIDDNFYKLMSRNFDNKICDIVSVPKVDEFNRHVEDPDRNIGKVIGLSRRDGKIYAQFEARDAQAAEKLGKTYLGASAFFSTNYKNNKTGERVGPTLLHVAVTNRPYATELEDYEEVFLSDVADGIDEAVVLTAAPKETKQMTLTELITALKVDHDIDVEELQEQAGQAERAIALTAKISESLIDNDFIALSDGDLSIKDIENAITSAREEIVSLSAQITEINEKAVRADAAARVQTLVDSALIPEAKAEVYIKLAMNDPESFEALIPSEALVELSNEEGTDSEDEAPVLTEEEVAAKDLERILSYEGFSFSPAKA